jgi:hypothetical protein
MVPDSEKKVVTGTGRDGVELQENFEGGVFVWLVRQDYTNQIWKSPP